MRLEIVDLVVFVGCERDRILVWWESAADEFLEMLLQVVLLLRVGGDSLGWMYRTTTSSSNVGGWS